MRRRWVAVMAAFLTAAAIGAGGAAAAPDPTGRVEAGAFVGGYVFDDAVHYEDGVIFGGRVGYWLTKDLVGELSVGDVPTEDEGRRDGRGVGASFLQTHLDALYHFNYFGGRFVPFVAAGAGGAMYNAPDHGGADWDWLVNYGVGAKYWITDTIAARLDVRQPITFDRTNRNFMYTLGVSYLFGGAPPAAPAPAAAPPAPPPPAPRAVAPVPTATLAANPATIQEGQSSLLSWTTRDANDVSIDGIGPVGASGSRNVTPGRTTTYRLTAKGEGGSQDATAQVAVVPATPLDSDQDGVPDSLDKCPGTPAGVKVDAQGCPLDSDKDGVPDYLDKCPGTPAGVKVDAQGCPLDSDKDGVPDYLDKCPGTPAGVAVDSQGCPLDSDKDGVPDYLDKCPGTPAGVAVDSQGCPLDSDKDGVPDYLDKCPGTPAGVAVDSQGCPLDSDKDGVSDYLDKCPDTPAGVAVDSQGCPLDSDKDGVPDYLDKCPGTPAGVAVDSQGCPLDSDGDGVPDYLDKCPNTPKGMKVDAQGCPPERKVIELMILFDFDKSDVKPQYFDQIQKVAAFMKERPELTLVMEGHTDSIGTEEYNLKLSARRANAVAKVLTEKFGIDLNRITAQSLGKSKPIASNATKEGRAKNRRVYAILESE